MMKSIINMKISFKKKVNKFFFSFQVMLYIYLKREYFIYRAINSLFR